ncbi:MAG: nucleotidyltransferase domain-containing protein [Methanomassiliicoccales archaeon]|nr:MAG: nucleotidyltransferase domain-containing protein [Methanomassiliicoccales archaeon]
MIELFEKYVDWKILAHFLEHSSQSFYVKELARILDVSPGSVSSALIRFKKWGLVDKEEKGQIHLYKLNNELVIIKELKKSFMLMKLQEMAFVDKLLRIDDNIISIALYGSYATGEYDDKSDLDILLIAPKKLDLNEFIEHIEKKLKKIVSIEVFSIGQWNKLKEREDPFYSNVMINHILLYGGELI